MRTSGHIQLLEQDPEKVANVTNNNFVNVAETLVDQLIEPYKWMKI